VSWIVAARFPRDKDLAKRAVKHWEELALDQGLDPVKNVRLDEQDGVYCVLISEDLDEIYRAGPGGWGA